MYHKEGKSCVIFERNYYTQHLQLQVKLVIILVVTKKNTKGNL